MTNKEYKTLIDHINKLILRYGMDIASESVFRLTTLNPDGSNYYQTDIDRELKICERKGELKMELDFPSKLI